MFMTITDSFPQSGHSKQQMCFAESTGWESSPPMLVVRAFEQYGQ